MYTLIITQQGETTMGTNMHRLQLYIPDAQMRFLQERARQARMSVAAVIRELVEREERAAEKPITQDPIWEVIGIGRSGARAASSVDATVYAPDWYERPPQTGRAATVAKRARRPRKEARP